MADTSGPEDNEQRLRCPACRAAQPWQDCCRRCQADLSLLVRALRYRRDQWLACRAAIAVYDLPAARRAARELLLLHPGPAERQLWQAIATADPAP
ncbi:MAG: hypothetical protein J5I93_01370 [Pirellulaceae bacterium]|nr:hypothetical protein [Pirellulaceae bacterium]